MKKILIIALSLFVLTSCGEIKTKDVQNIGDDSVRKIKQYNKTLEQKGSVEKEKKVSFSDIEESLRKLKKIGVGEDDLRFINDDLKSFYDRTIRQQAISKNDINICNKLEKNSVESCKKQVIIKSEKIESCDNLTEKYSKIDCKNTILQTQANTKLDESICDKLEDDSEEKFQINSCKNRIFQEKARKNLDIKVCYKIIDKMEKKMCVEIVKIEKGIIKEKK